MIPLVPFMMLWVGAAAVPLMISFAVACAREENLGTAAMLGVPATTAAVLTATLMTVGIYNLCIGAF